MNQIVSEKVALLPNKPGVYKMFDASGTVIYVGKAVNLKNRVRQYFQSGAQKHPKVAAMVSHIADFEYILTANETEALTLESNLIKQFKPHYNILLKDDKHFPYVRVDVRKDFPRFEVARKLQNDGAKYFGPYLSEYVLKESMKIIREHYPVRHCKKDINKSIARGERPCLMYHIGQCCAPCTGKVSREEYHKYIDEIISFLNGNTADIASKLKKSMEDAAEELDFETAAMYRDRLNALKGLNAKQTAIGTDDVSRDAFALVDNGENKLIFAMFVRSGKIIGTRAFDIDAQGEDDSEVIASFLKQFYYENSSVPREILLNCEPSDCEAIELWLRYICGSAVYLSVPVRGEKHEIIKLAENNGRDTLEKRRQLKIREWERGEGALTQLSGILGLDFVPSRIECYDNSHMSGKDTVGAMIVFIDGKSAKNEYRRFRIRSETNGDDYLAMHEVLTRRFERAAHDVKFASLPELIIVDGGRGQLNVALSVLDELGLSQINAIGLAERNEELILPDRSEPVRLEKNSPMLHFVQRIRDEAHRFAITYHRSMRSKSALYSVLDGIEGVGDKRKRAIFDKFLTVEEIKNASVEDIAAIKGMTHPVAQKVYDFFHNKD